LFGQRLAGRGWLGLETTNRSDRHAMQVAEDRMKEFKHELRKMGYRV